MYLCYLLFSNCFNCKVSCHRVSLKHNQISLANRGHLHRLATSYMVGREDKRTKSRTMFPALKNNAAAGYQGPVKIQSEPQGDMPKCPYYPGSHKNATGTCFIATKTKADIFYHNKAFNFLTVQSRLRTGEIKSNRLNLIKIK